MTPFAPPAGRPPTRRTSFDSIFESLSKSRFSGDEAELLRESHWSLGQDARLREDARFRQTRWGRWVSVKSWVANDAAVDRLRHSNSSSLETEIYLAELDKLLKRRCALCTADPRLVFDDGKVRLSARELTDEPRVEQEVTALEKYVTHLPLHTLQAAAASAPAGEWGSRAQEEVIETAGWMRVIIPERLNKRMFVARVVGNSMDDGRSGLANGRYAVFELWPTGSRQGLIVLARGSFSDPETGSYAVKRYVADERAADRTHQRIALVSLNPDKARFPDIELARDRADDTAIVARLVRVLTGTEIARRPKPPTRPGRRDLSATTAIVEDIDAFCRRFFEEPGRSADTKEAAKTWTSEFVCVDAEAGGPHVEIGPLTGMWTFVKQLRISGRDWKHHVLASNAREHRVRVPVPLSSGPWRWEAVGFEDDPDVDLSGLTVPALEPDRVHIFRVDAAGIGRRVTGPTLSRRQHYRVVIPDVCWMSIHKPPVAATFDAWHLWEFESGDDVQAVADILRDLGLDLGEQDVRLEWVLVPPVQWNYSPKGAPYAVFLNTSSVLLSVIGPPTDVDGGAQCYVTGPQTSGTLSLPRGTNWIVQLTDLLPGRYTLAVLYDSTRIAPAQAAFEVVAKPPKGTRAEFVVAANKQSITLQPGAPTRLNPSDLGAALTSTDSTDPVVAQAPPGWPVRILWSEISQELLCSLNADEDGYVDPERLVSVALERVRTRLVGDFIIDAGELGRLVWPHYRRQTPGSVRSNIAEIVRTRKELVERLAGSYELLLTRWFEPLCAELGYEVTEVPDQPDTLPGHFRVCKLYRVVRRGERIVRAARRLLVLSENIEHTEDQVRQWLDELCFAHDLAEVLLTDGVRWALHRVDARVPLRLWNLEAVIEDESAFMDFLREFAEGV